MPVTSMLAEGKDIELASAIAGFTVLHDGGAMGGVIVDLENETRKWLVSPSWKLCMPWKQNISVIQHTTR